MFNNYSMIALLKAKALVPQASTACLPCGQSSMLRLLAVLHHKQLNRTLEDQHLKDLATTGILISHVKCLLADSNMFVEDVVQE